MTRDDLLQLSVPPFGELAALMVVYEQNAEDVAPPCRELDEFVDVLPQFAWSGLTERFDLDCYQITPCLAGQPGDVNEKVGSHSPRQEWWGLAEFSHQSETELVREALSQLVVEFVAVSPLVDKMP